jgi:flavorubredoxin
MRVLMVYDTVSNAKVTGKVADAVAGAMAEAGVPVEAHFVEDASKVSVKDYDCLVVGAPTMAWRPSKRMKDFLASLKGTDFSGKVATTFDTQMRSSISGNATKHMEKGLTELGFRIVSPALVAYVESENKAYRLKDGEIEKAKAWGKELAKALAK